MPDQEVEKLSIKQGLTNRIHMLEECIKEMLPTDRLYCNVATSVIAMAISLVSFGIISTGSLAFTTSRLKTSEEVLYNGAALAFYLLSGSVTIGLFWGLHKGIKKYISSWILFKFAEVWLLSIAIVLIICGRYPGIGIILFGVIFGCISCYFNWTVYKKYRRMTDNDELSGAPTMDTPPHYDRVVNEM